MLVTWPATVQSVLVAPTGAIFQLVALLKMLSKTSTTTSSTTVPAPRNKRSSTTVVDTVKPLPRPPLVQVVVAAPHLHGQTAPLLRPVSQPAISLPGCATNNLKLRVRTGMEAVVTAATTVADMEAEVGVEATATVSGLSKALASSKRHRHGLVRDPQAAMVVVQPPAPATLSPTLNSNNNKVTGSRATAGTGVGMVLPMLVVTVGTEATVLKAATTMPVLPPHLLPMATETATATRLTKLHHHLLRVATTFLLPLRRLQELRTPL